MKNNSCKISLFLIFMFLGYNYVLSNPNNSSTVFPFSSTDFFVSAIVTTEEIVTTRYYPSVQSVKGIRTCAKTKKCPKFCTALSKAYGETFDSSLPYYILGVFLLVLILISLVLWIKTREIADDHSQELDLKGLSLREQKNELIFAEPDPDAESSKFKKRGGVLIATDLNRAFKKNDKTKKNDVEMGPVQYVETDNEQYEFGDDQDQFENRKNENTITKTETITKTVETPK